MIHGNKTYRVKIKLKYKTDKLLSIDQQQSLLCKINRHRCETNDHRYAHQFQNVS